ncbi:alpha-glucosidase [Nocardioides guangzhouensis]|uniref:Alpha-glucosidase n=1 Tax=Nocardioides guangzhouensis TaxID=2497878 RepID=A0A4Q4ZJD7_9ACTN|nr:glycoside hydrolase family 13 protein [Nocardioides guangzhouensis]RYP88410.1 alpha-glucosidase [Nocardioides guangzhouensis]
MADAHAPWWRHAVIYEVYPRSFADGNGDGEGDLAGLRARLPYLRDIGVDGIWIAPWYPSPMADGGYDVSDYTGIDPRYGTLDEADALIREAHDLGLRVIVDVVPNHTSEQHPWFRAALAAAPGSPERARYLFRDGAGPDGDRPPNNWISCFGGGAWERVTEPDGTPGQFYMHMFAPEQPDLDWSNPDVVEAFDGILRFWFDRGVDGIRVDAAPAMGKAADLPDADYGPEPAFRTLEWTDNPHWDVDHVHDIFRRWRTVADAYDGDRVFVAEAVVSGTRLRNYLRPDEMHTAFNFPYMKTAWEASALRAVIDETIDLLAPMGAPATWVLASHDETRLVSRYGRATTSSGHVADGQGEPVDLALGTRRARAATLLMLALPGGAYLYQGEELGLPEVDDLPDEVLQDPMFARSNGAMRGRDGCRVPLPWSGDHPPYGFGAEGVATWLPQPADWAPLTAEAQAADAGSMLSLHRDALRIRREVAALCTDHLSWRAAPDGVLDFDRGPGFRCVVNLSGAPLPLTDASVLLSSLPLEAGALPHDAAAWLGD